MQSNAAATPSSRGLVPDRDEVVAAPFASFAAFSPKPPPYHSPVSSCSNKNILVLGPVSRILFHALRRFGRHFSRPVARPAGRLAGCPAKPPTAAYPRLWGGPPSRLFCLAPDGVFRAADVAVGAVGSYPTFSPLPSTARLSPGDGGRFVFCDTVRRRALKRGARTCGEARAASCPAVSGLSSPAVRRARRYPRLGIKERWSDDQAPKPRPPPEAVEGPRSNAQ